MIKSIKYDDIGKGMKSFISEMWILIKRSPKSVLPFLLLYSIFNIIFSNVIVTLAIDVMQFFYKTTYAGPDNLIDILLSPMSIIIFVIMGVLISLLSIVEIAGVMHAFSMARVGKIPTFSGMIYAGLHCCKKSLRIQNFPIILFIMVLLPLTQFYNLSFKSLSLAVPGFIMEFIFNDTLLHVLYRVLYWALFLLEVSCIFALNYYLLEDIDFIPACKKSIELISKKYLQTVIVLVLVALALSVLTSGFSACVLTLIERVESVISSVGMKTNNELISKNLFAVTVFIRKVIEPGVNIAALTTLFFTYLENKNQLSLLKRDSFKDGRLSRLGAIVIAIITVAGGVFYFGDMFKNPLFDGQQLARPAIVAHRGDSLNAPENTMPAFELAILESPDCIELDVHQTKDGVIMVSHDDDLLRVSGKKLHVQDLTYAELQDLDVGSWFSPEYSHVRLSTLDEVLKLCKDKIDLQIEIKSDGLLDNIEEKLLQLVNDNAMRDHVTFISLDKEPLERLKALDPGIKTAYCMYVAIDEITDVECSDDFTVEESNITEKLVNYVHSKGRKIFAWTINDPDDVQYLIDCGVDGIVTDSPLMIREALNNADYSNGISKIIRRYLSQLSYF